jgi:hypothetical protein
VTANPTDSAKAMRDRRGSADPTTLPNSCRCGARWAGTSTAHCAAACCHRTFSGVTTFDVHRRDGRCNDPAGFGMSLLRGRAYDCWGYPEQAAQ